MRVIKFVVSLPIFVFFLLAGCAKQATLDLGGQRITAPVPQGFTPLGDRAPRFRALEERALSPAKLIEYYLTDRDLQDVLAGHSKFREKSLSITMPAAMYGSDFSEENFLGASYFRRNVEGKTFSKDEGLENNKVEAESRKWGSVPLLSSNGKWLGVFLDKHDAIGAASVSSVHIDGALKKTLSLSITTRVKNRFIILGCASFVSNDSEIYALEDTCSRWAIDILKDNPDSIN